MLTCGLAQVFWFYRVCRYVGVVALCVRRAAEAEDAAAAEGEGAAVDLNS